MQCISNREERSLCQFKGYNQNQNQNQNQVVSLVVSTILLIITRQLLLLLQHHHLPFNLLSKAYYTQKHTKISFTTTHWPIFFLALGTAIWAILHSLQTIKVLRSNLCWLPSAFFLSPLTCLYKSLRHEQQSSRFAKNDTISRRPPPNKSPIFCAVRHRKEQPPRPRQLQ